MELCRCHMGNVLPVASVSVRSESARNHRWRQGSATLEYAFVFPLVILIVLVLLQSILLLHDKAILEASLWDATSAAARLWHLSAEELTLDAMESSGMIPSPYPENRDMYWQLKNVIELDQSKKDVCIAVFRKRLLLELGARSALPGSGLRQLHESDLDVRIWTNKGFPGSQLCATVSIPVEGFAGSFIRRLPGQRQACIGAHAEVVMTAPASFIQDVDWAIQLIGRTKGGTEITEVVQGVRKWIQMRKE